jgi:hypothetical protein
VYVTNKGSSTIDAYEVQGTKLAHIQTMATSPNPIKVAPSPTNKIVTVLTLGANAPATQVPVRQKLNPVQPQTKKWGALGKSAPITTQQIENEDPALNVFPVVCCDGQLDQPQIIPFDPVTNGTPTDVAFATPDRLTIAFSPPASSPTGEGKVAVHEVLNDGLTVNPAALQDLTIPSGPLQIAYSTDGTLGAAAQVNQVTGMSIANGEFAVENTAEITAPGQTLTPKAIVINTGGIGCNEPGTDKAVLAASVDLTENSSLTFLCQKPDGTVTTGIPGAFSEPSVSSMSTPVLADPRLLVVNFELRSTRI